jgi:hypothetical protein
MPEDPPTEPETMLALVGTSPTPPLLSALTFRPKRLVLAHSSNAERRAGHIREVLEDRPDAPTVECHDLGPEVFDFHAVKTRLEELFTKLGPDDWRLCYTGGTKVMALSAVLAHLKKYPEHHQWRSYLDVHRNTFTFTDGRTRVVGDGDRRQTGEPPHGPPQLVGTVGLCVGRREDGGTAGDVAVDDVLVSVLAGPLEAVQRDERAGDVEEVGGLLDGPPLWAVEFSA